MKKVSQIAFFLLGFVIIVGESRGQEMDSTTVMHLDSNLLESLVFADSVYVGRASQVTFNIPGGTKEITLVPPDIDSWSMAPVSEAFLPLGQDTVRLSINFPFHYKIESVPYDGSIYIEQPEERKLLGSTPLLYTSEEPLKGMLLLTHDGYESVRLTPGEDVWNLHVVEFTKQQDEELISTRYWTPEKSTNRWIDYTAAGVALVGGILAIHYKTKANRRFDNYRISGDPALRDGFQQYDRYSAYSLGAMQAGIGVLAVRFVIK